ncbi:uncharacterized protein LOC132708567 isoform X2 [Cylas formicarius]|uniref:uncharacterized protein LOC132708567 isoform X2 n=1 Tax=Cylas formicarius TaxID=197179 RepID=UPI0029585D67|nr:uncharacterized protein LOC132708567 isoform X2 [Cylas formicarius]
MLFFVVSVLIYLFGLILCTKNEVTREKTRTPSGTNSNGNNQLTTPPVRKERVKKTKQELSEEAAEVLRQVDSLDCIARQNGNFYTVPRKGSALSLDRKVNKRRSSLELTPPKKPPRSFTGNNQNNPSFFDIFKKSDKSSKPKAPNLRRSISDVSSLKSIKFGPSGSDSSKRRKKSESDSECTLETRNKKQLSPIIEAIQPEDYFACHHHPDKENIDINVQQPEKTNPSRESITEKLKEYIDEIDEEIYKETGIRYKNNTEPRTEPQPIIIDLDKAEKISSGKKSKFKYSGLGKKIKSLTHRKHKTSNDSPEEIKVNTNPARIADRGLNDHDRKSIEPKIQTSVTELEMSAEKINSQDTGRLHRKGGTVDRMVKRLNSAKCSSPPPRPVPLVTPNKEIFHNNNLPFSYTNSSGAEKLTENSQPGSPIIYAQVVCGENSIGPTKHTVHTFYPSTKKQPQSDSDEGLGCDESLGNKSFTHFGDRNFSDSHSNVYFDDIYRLQESPILPKYKNTTQLNGFSDANVEYTNYMNSSYRGCGDGMDTKRRESLTESPENGINLNISYKDAKADIRDDLVKRRDLLESRSNRRINEIKSTTPEYPRISVLPIMKTNQTSLDYRSVSPLDGPLFENKMTGYKARDEIRKFTTRHVTDYSLNSFDSEPKSFDSQASEYRSSPENRQFDPSHSLNKRTYYERHKLLKNKKIYKSTPEIHPAPKYRNDNSRDTSYHDSLRKEKKIDPYINSKMYDLDKSYCSNSGSISKLDKFIDSGIETDIKRESADSYRLTKASRRYKEYFNESEDEGFASSLLINNERQHPEDRFGENFNYKSGSTRERNESDVSYYDSKYDDSSTIKQLDMKPPKPEKKSSLEKVKSLFTRDSKKKKEKALREERLKNMKYQKDKQDVRNKYNTHERTEPYLTDDDPYLSNIDDETIISVTNSNSRNLRFFGDTDAESNDSLRALNKPILKNGPTTRTRQVRDVPSGRQDTGRKKTGHTLTSVKDRESRGSYLNHKPPISPSHSHIKGKQWEDKLRISKNELSSLESSTEGESSQQSQRSVVYLHAASVGDIPSPGYLRNGRRTASREELSSNVSSRIQPQVKTLSRSFSVLAPWKPRHSRESLDIDYSQYSKNNKYDRKTKSIPREHPIALRKKKQDSGRTNLRESKSKESLTLRTSAEETEKGSSSTLYKKKNRLPKENHRYTKDKEEKKMSKSHSAESLNRKCKDTRPDISRSVSMPRDTKKMAGWFRRSKNS